MKKIPKFKNHIHNISYLQSQNVTENREEILPKMPHFRLSPTGFSDMN